MNSTVKHNYFSDEFIAKVVVQIWMIIAAAHGMIPPKIMAIAVPALTAIYMICRTVYKIKDPTKDLPPLPSMPADVSITTTVNPPANS